MKMWTKICRKLESSLSFSHDNTGPEETYQRPIKAMHHDERFLSLAFNLYVLQWHIVGYNNE